MMIMCSHEAILSCDPQCVWEQNLIASRVQHSSDQTAGHTHIQYTYTQYIYMSYSICYIVYCTYMPRASSTPQTKQLPGWTGHYTYIYTHTYIYKCLMAYGIWYIIHGTYIIYDICFAIIHLLSSDQTATSKIKILTFFSEENKPLALNGMPQYSATLTSLQRSEGVLASACSVWQLYPSSWRLSESKTQPVSKCYAGAG